MSHSRQRDRGGQTRHRIELAVLVDELPGVGNAEATGGEPVRRFRLRRAVGDADEQFPECRSPSRVSSDSGVEVGVDIGDRQGPGTASTHNLGRRCGCCVFGDNHLSQGAAGWSKVVQTLTPPRN